MDDGFKHTVAAIPAGSTRRTWGTAYYDGAKWWANMNGSLLDARWMDPIQPIQNGKIVVDITKDERGQATALVMGGYTDQPRPSTGVILAFGVLEIVISGEDTRTYTTKRYLGPIEDYALGDNVYITWDAATPTILGKVNEITVTPPTPPPPPPAEVASGEVTLIATASDTFGVGGWGRWATSQGGGEDVYTGTIGGYTVTGAWFYGAPKPELQGKPITRIRFRLPGRLPAVGAYNSPVTIYLYAHTSGARPGGDVSRVTAAHPVTIPAGWAGGDIDLPLDFAATVVAGGGISIAGGAYAGFKSRLKDGESGKTIMNWRI